MDRQPDELTVEITPRAMRDLDGIWDYNAGKWSPAHAEKYVAFLLKETFKLAENGGSTKPVRGVDGVYFTVIRRSKKKGSGAHVAVFQVVDQVIEVLRYFHTSQDWESRLGGAG